MEIPGNIHSPENSVTGHNIGFIEFSNQTLYETFVFMTQTAPKRKPKILAWDILTHDYQNSEKLFNVGLTEKQENMVIEIQNFEDNVPSDDENNGDSINIAANKDLLLVNHQSFNSVKGFLFCGFQ